MAHLVNLCDLHTFIVNMHQDSVETWIFVYKLYKKIFMYDIMRKSQIIFFISILEGLVGIS